ncbi:hypothetical protein HRbin20_01546 [bacterium HR20]|nr:hypothetical protein HRbin20_01546 [bacterium HR20]
MWLGRGGVIAAPTSLGRYEAGKLLYSVAPCPLVIEG